MNLREDPHYCVYCGHWTRYGRHYPDGKFNPNSVDVAWKEVAFYRRAAVLAGQYNRTPERIRANIALGYHSMARDCAGVGLQGV